MRKYLSLLASFIFSGCVMAVPVAVTPSITEFTLNQPRKEVFDSALAVATEMNLSVGVLEKESGFIRFDRAALSAPQLDGYCRYPYVNPNTQQPWDTFQNWNNRSIANRVGAVSGSVSLTLLLAEAGTKETKATLRSNITAGNLTERTECNSTGSLESEFKTKLESRIASIAPVKSSKK